MAGTMHNLDWLFALGVIFFSLSTWANGANDVANSYGTSVASGSLTLIQAGVLCAITETVGSLALGAGVTSTVRSGVFAVSPFIDSPGTLILSMVCAEFGSGLFVAIASKFGFPVSTTHSVVGALVGVGIAGNLHVNWGWKKSSVSQIAASWVVAPGIAACFGALIFLSIKYTVLKRSDPLKWGLRMIPFYFGFTGSILALFIVISGGPGMPSIEAMGPGKVVGIILGCFAGCMLISYVFFMPYFFRRLVKEDHRIRFGHVLLGPLLWKEDCWLPFPRGEDSSLVPDYYHNTYLGEDGSPDRARTQGTRYEGSELGTEVAPQTLKETKANRGDVEPDTRTEIPAGKVRAQSLENVDDRPWYSASRLLAILKYIALRGVTKDVLGHQSEGLATTHARAPKYDNKVEHLWTAAQVVSAMLMSVAHGSNDVSNSIGPFTTEFLTWDSGVASAEVETPLWIRAVGGLGLSVGFWTYGYHLMRNLGNRITQHSPTRGYSMELGTAITVLMASKLSLPISTTQCITGATLGVALMNFDPKTINGRQVAKIFSGWVITLPAAGLLAGIPFAMALNAPSWGY